MMSDSFIYSVIEIFIACFLIEICFRLYDKLKDRSLDILSCDYCEEAHHTRKTPDSRFYLCRKCMQVYLDELKFSKEVIQRTMQKFKAKPPAKIMKGKKKKTRKNKKPYGIK